MVKFLFLRAESKSHADVKGRRITGRGVNARRVNVSASLWVNAYWRIGQQARFKVIPRFKIAFVEAIINREIQVNPLSQTFGNRKINDIVTCGANRIVFDRSRKIPFNSADSSIETMSKFVFIVNQSVETFTMKTTHSRLDSLRAKPKRFR